ncbi:hypothetical protein BS78_K074100 [Paspalum vaginatum]|uniref:Uncharacterized protein n=1 Tax=Paspalum vaginatum TaxID=158149 RepID=A0A9W7X8A5_9POAL|nr:hypothetical protein BS78_K074100 [Paspalum vaginatum]
MFPSAPTQSALRGSLVPATPSARRLTASSPWSVEHRWPALPPSRQRTPRQSRFPCAARMPMDRGELASPPHRNSPPRNRRLADRPSRPLRFANGGRSPQPTSTSPRTRCKLRICNYPNYTEETWLTIEIQVGMQV